MSISSIVGLPKFSFDLCGPLTRPGFLFLDGLLSEIILSDMLCNSFLCSKSPSLWFNVSLLLPADNGFSILAYQQ